MKQAAVVLVILGLVAGLYLVWPQSEPNPPETEDLSTPIVERTPVDEEADQLANTTKAANKGMSLELDDLSNFEPGDDIALFIPQEDSVHEGRVTSVDITQSGNRVVTGFLDGNHRFVFTIGRFQTFGTIQTQAGRYQLEVREGVGRIVSVQTINEGLDFTQPDFVVPEQKRMRPIEPAAEKEV